MGVPPILAVDANVMISALIGGKAWNRLLRKAIETKSDLELLTTEEQYAEVAEKVPAIAARTRVPEPFVRFALEALPVQVVERKEYDGAMERVPETLNDRDPDDVPLAALAIARVVPIWSDDPDLLETDFSGIGVRVYSTKELLLVIEE